MYKFQEKSSNHGKSRKSKRKNRSMTPAKKSYKSGSNKSNIILKNKNYFIFNSKSLYITYFLQNFLKKSKISFSNWKKAKSEKKLDIMI